MLKIAITKGRIERSRIIGYNTNKRHNISEITKEICTKPLYKKGVAIKFFKLISKPLILCFE